MKIFLDLLGSDSSYSKQAFSKARKKLKYTAFIEMNQKFQKSFYSTPPTLFDDKYLLFAVDGSLCQLYDSKELDHHFGSSKNQYGNGLSMGRASVVYDVLNKVAVDCLFSSCTTSEQVLFSQHHLTLNEGGLFTNTPILYLMDRGYAGYKLFEKLIEAGDFFLIRCKEGYRNEIKEFVKKNIEQDNITLTAKGKQLHLRVVRVELESGEFEYLLTNTLFSIKELYKLYFMRWKVETFYAFVKENLQLENFSSKSVEGVLQDFHACMLTANISSLLIEEAQEELSKEESSKRQPYQLNRNVALGILKNKIPPLLLGEGEILNQLEKLKQRIKRHKVPIKPNRTFKRNKFKRSQRKNHITKKKAF